MDKLSGNFNSSKGNADSVSVRKGPEKGYLSLSHGGNMGSNPLGDANLFNGLAIGGGSKMASVSNTGPISTHGLGCMRVDRADLDPQC